MPISTASVRELLDFGREQSGVEFKSAGALTDPVLRAKVLRGMLAMANRRDGGLVIVGVREDGPKLELDGLTQAQLDSWKHDILADNVAEYADPRLTFNTSTIEVDEHELLVIAVDEFPDVPVICKRSLQEGKTNILRDGAIYVRSNRKPESREVANYDEMRELIDIATDKGVRRFVSRATSAGLALASTTSAQDAYRAERGDL